MTPDPHPPYFFTNHVRALGSVLKNFKSWSATFWRRPCAA
jgi:hypothetical protein